MIVENSWIVDETVGDSEPSSERGAPTASGTVALLWHAAESEPVGHPVMVVPNV